MLPVRVCLRCTGLTLFIAAMSACSNVADDVRISIQTNLTAPRGLLDNAVRVTLLVYDASDTVTCDATTGIATAIETTPKIATGDLTSTDCAPGVRFCRDLRITKADSDRLFVATALDAQNERIAQGCTAKKVIQDAFSVDIKMHRVLPPSACGNSVVEALEQCDPPSTFFCNASCKSIEVTLSVGSTEAGTKTGDANEKRDALFLWPEGTGSTRSFFGFFTDTSSGGTNVGFRVLDANFSPLSSPPALAKGFVLLTNDAKPKPAQALPQAVSSDGRVWIAFESDGDVQLRSLNPDFSPGESSPSGVNGIDGRGEPGKQTLPSLAAGSNKKLFVVWQDESGSPTGSGKIYGRLFTSPNVLGSQQELSSGTLNARPAIVARPDSFAVVWESGGDIKLRSVSLEGTPAGPEIVVNEVTAGVQERPRIAALSDGKFAVVWADRGAGNSEIFFQRFTAQGTKIAGDQGRPLNDKLSAGDQITPAVAGTAAGAGAFLVVWLDQASGDVRGRYAGTSGGFPFNPVDGTNSEFLVSVTSSRQRKNPTVAIGGAGPFAAVGWEDLERSLPGPGIVARRLPVPIK